MKSLTWPWPCALLLLFIFLPLGELQACAYFDDDSMIAARDACQADASREWSCDLNRCVTTAQAKEARDDYLECAKMEGDKARKACHDEYAKNYTGDLESKEPPHMMATGINAAFAGLMGIASLSKNPNGGSCFSKWIVLGTGATAIASELYFRFMAGKDLEKLQENYKDETSSEPYYAQVRALEYLKQEQEALSKMAGNRKKAYMLQTAGYTVAVATALYEGLTKTNCGPKEEGQAEASETATTTPAEASTETASAGAVEGAGAGAKISEGVKGMGAMLGSPIGVGIVAGAGAALSGYMWKVSADQEKQSSENAKKVQAMIDQFQAAMAGYCPQGRDDYNNPRCYCYNADKTRNSNRSRSESCQALWAAEDQNYFVAANSYGKNNKAASSGCMTVNGRYDQECACKKLKNNKGQNACLKVPATATSISGIDSALGTTSVAKQINGINNGEFSAADLSAASMEKLAARAADAKKQIEKQVNAKRKAQKKAPAPRLTNQFVEKMLSATPSNYSGQMLSDFAPVDLTKSRPTDDYFNQALQKAIESGNLKEATIQGGRGINPGTKSGAPGFNFADGGGGGTKVENFMEKEYQLGESDINSRDDIPIWTIISNRYTISGLKRLFDSNTTNLDEGPVSEE